MPDDAAPILTGTVVRAAGGGIYEVHVAGHEPGVLHCSLRGKLKQGRQIVSQPVVVGDQVRVEANPGTGLDGRGRDLSEGSIAEVLPRRSMLARSRHRKLRHITMANLDQMVVVMSLRQPDLNTHRLDRFLVLAEASELPAPICLNKSDLLPRRQLEKEIKPLLQLYQGLGYRCLCTSASKDTGIEELRDQLTGHISVFTGSSGVGKSSLVMAVQPELQLWTSEVMDIGKGRHTTTEVTLHPLDGGGYIADTPGIKTVSLLEQEEVNLPLCFPEMAPLLGQCRFNDCSHQTEPGCAVRDAVAAGTITPARYDSYLKMLADAQALPPSWAVGKGLS